jgi:metal-responsive CopG/Arc/MetJ family transcriptional regulator
MKTAISIPDPLFARAEDCARQMGVSRSQFFAKAVDDLVTSIERQAMIVKLTEFYSRETSQLDPVLHALQLESLMNSEEGRDW